MHQECVLTENNSNPVGHTDLPGGDPGSDCGMPSGSTPGGSWTLNVWGFGAVLVLVLVLRAAIQGKTT